MLCKGRTTEKKVPYDEIVTAIGIHLMAIFLRRSTFRSCQAATQRAQYPLIEESSSNQNMKHLTIL